MWKIVWADVAEGCYAMYLDPSEPIEKNIVHSCT